MLMDEKDQKKKKKPSLLGERMGIDQGSGVFSPPAAQPAPVAQPGLFPGSAAMALNDQNNEVANKIDDKLKTRRNMTGGRM